MTLTRSLVVQLDCSYVLLLSWNNILHIEIIAVRSIPSRFTLFSKDGFPLSLIITGTMYTFSSKLPCFGERWAYVPVNKKWDICVSSSIKFRSTLQLQVFFLKAPFLLTAVPCFPPCLLRSHWFADFKSKWTVWMLSLAFCVICSKNFLFNF